MQRTANPCMPVRFRPRPPKIKTPLWRFHFWKSGVIEPAGSRTSQFLQAFIKMRRKNHTSGESSCVGNGRRVRRCELSGDMPPKIKTPLRRFYFREQRASVSTALRRDKESNDDTPALRATPTRALQNRQILWVVPPEGNLVRNRNKTSAPMAHSIALCSLYTICI